MSEARRNPDDRPAARPDSAVRPLALHLDRQKELTIRWGDGHESRYPLPYLRAKCPCATCRESAPREKSATTSLTILPANFQARGVAVGASLVGNYAVQIDWADGHNTGIYDFRYLREIDPGASDGVHGAQTR